MKKSLALALLLSAAAAAPALAAPPAPQGTPQPKIVVIDRQAILQYSKVGQDIAKQIQAYGNQAKADISGQEKSLQAQAQTLSQQVAILAPDVKAQKVKDFENKQAALQAAAQKKEGLIQGGFLKARQAVEGVLGPIIAQVVAQRGANIVLDKQAVVYAPPNNNLEITAAVITLLNQKMPSYKVQLTPLPPGVQPQAQ